MLTNFFIFAAALLMVVRGATLSTQYASRFASSLRLSKYTVGFIVIAIISILPETFISINAALRDVPAFGLGMLLGSNVADLTLIFALVILLSGRSMAVEQKILKSHVLYPLILLVPIILGLDGHFSRIEGGALVLLGFIFYYLALRSEQYVSTAKVDKRNRYLNLTFLLISLTVLLGGSYFIVTSATALATSWGVSPVLIGMLVVGLGTTMPEFFFALKSMKQNDDSLAVGDLLGTVLADATIVIGILALLNPFDFPKTTIYIGGVFMVAASFILFNFMRSGRTITKKESFSLIIFWATFIMVEFITGV
jgi:cation:H+ antiporter